MRDSGAVQYDVVIPARDEELTIAAVISAARAAQGAQRVIVVDDGSTDRTAAVAAAAGATVIGSRGSASKALALATGVAEATAGVIVFFDADILGADPMHFEALAAPLFTSSFSMSCGLVDYGPLKNRLFLRLPPITGLRAVRREVFEAVAANRLNGFQIEIMINEVIARGHLPTSIRVLTGAGHRSKVDKMGMVNGSAAHLRMTAELLHCFTFVPLWTYGSYLRNLTILPPSGRS